MHSLSKLKLSNVLSTQPVLTKFNVQSSTTYYAAFATTNSSTTFISSASKFHNPTTPTTAASIDTKIDKTQEEIKTTNDNREEIEGEGEEEEEEEGHSQCSSLVRSSQSGQVMVLKKGYYQFLFLRKKLICVF